MPVRKFRTLEEAERSLWLEPGDPRIWQAHVRRWKLHQFFARCRVPVLAPGMYKYRSLEEKQRCLASRAARKVND